MTKTATLIEALTNFQDSVVFVKAKRTANYGKYAQLKDVVTETRPGLKKHGLHVFQALTHIDGQAAITTELHHVASGESLSTTTPLVHKPEDPQKWGAAITYARRYAYVTILGLLVDEDDDGELASRREEVKPYLDDIETQVREAKSVAELKRLFDAMPAKQRTETTKLFTARKMELQDASANS